MKRYKRCRSANVMQRFQNDLQTHKRTEKKTKTKNKKKTLSPLYIPLKSNISNGSNTAYLKTKVDMFFFTIKYCKCFTFTKGHGAGVTVGKCMRMEIFSFDLMLHFSSLSVCLSVCLSLSLSLSLSTFAFSCTFRMLGHLSRT